VKRIYYTILLALVATALHGQGIKLQEMPLADACRLAGEQGKLVFVDFYTGWCMPCAEMAKRLENEQAAADFFDPRFVCVKFDLEHGEGKMLRDRFRVTGIPTYAIFSPDGTELFRRVGTLPLDAFIEKIRVGMDPANAIDALEEEYRSGTMSRERVMAYTRILSEGSHVARSVEVADALLSSLSGQEKLDPLYWPAFRDRYITPTLSANFRFLLDNLDTFRARVDPKELDRKLEEGFYILNGFLAGHYGVERLSTLDSVAALIPPYDLPRKRDLEQKASLARVQCTADVEGIVACLERVFADGTSPDWFWQCEKSLDIVSARGTADHHRRLSSLSALVLSATPSPRRELLARLFHAFPPNP
jgi:thiol-disulfide isomerase/thioredoxin